MILNPGEVYLVETPFHQRQGAKVRPAIILLDSGDDDFLGIPVTTVGRPHALDVSIQDLVHAGLRLPSFARLPKIALLRKLDIRRRLGDLSRSDWLEVKNKLCGILCRTHGE